MHTRTVYRVEREDGTGPYNRGMGYNEIHREVDSFCDEARHPMPYNDGIRDMEGAHVFGFATRATFEQWFNATERQRLAAHDYSLTVYDVPREHVTSGRSQCIFRKDHAKRVRVEALT